MHHCDVNGDGVTSLSDAFCVSDYLKGLYNILQPEVADFNNDGFVSQADVIGIEYLGINIKKLINPDYTPSKSTKLLNTDVDYYRYNAKTGQKIGTKYTVNATPTVSSPSGKSIIGNDDRVEDYTHSGICTIYTTMGFGTGFVASDNSILTAGHFVKGSIILSICFYDDNGNVIFKPKAIDYSVPVNYSPKTDTDYALITVSDDLSDYNNLNIGYALQYAIDTHADVSVTGYQPLYAEDDEENKDKDNPYEIRTGKGRLLSLSDDTILCYDCDVLPCSSGGPIYADLIFEGKHYYTVVGINTTANGNYNSGVRMCPNITNLVRSNLK